ncbi:type II toxin-antitoxin system antitoxin SocA domain-containing protein [Streptomyces sp. NBC_01538]|uniref:type II toxin-antitoxin system antitoxin SocA domain-containing protein n=1 Tax=Streptomyces sp. NBC_01538 TaxID=2903897 RepID=UPI003863B8F3
MPQPSPIDRRWSFRSSYYCQAWHRAWEGRALFPEAIQAWASGPVCPELYELHQGHFEIEAGFFAKRLRVRSDLGTA